MSIPLLSVIIPVYKVEGYLEQCVEGVLRQSLTDLEVLLVNDGSPDGCPGLCDEYARKDSRVRVVHQDNLGLAGARNSGLRLARGDYVAFLDSDDYLEPDAYAKLYAMAVRHNADIVFCQAQYFDDTTGKVIAAEDSSSLPLFSGEIFSGAFTWRDVGADKIFSYDSFVVAWNKICKRSFLAEFRADFPLGLIYEDNPFYFQTIFAAKRLCVVRERLVTYRINRKGSIIRDVAEGNDARAMHILAILADIERRLQSLALENVGLAFYRYALHEVAYKYWQIPNLLRPKYLSLAKGLLPFELYWELRLYLWKKEVKWTRFFDRRMLRLFGIPPLISKEQFSEVPGEYDSVVFMGEERTKTVLPKGAYTGNAFLECREFTLGSLLNGLDAFIASPTSGHRGYRIEHRRHANAEAHSVRGLIAISESVLLIDLSPPSLTPEDLKSLFYALNCIFFEKSIHFLALAKPVLGLTGSARAPKGLDLVPQGEDGKISAILRNKKLKMFDWKLIVKVLGLPVVAVRRIH